MVSGVFLGVCGCGWVVLLCVLVVVGVVFVGGWVLVVVFGLEVSVVGGPQPGSTHLDGGAAPRAGVRTTSLGSLHGVFFLVSQTQPGAHLDLCLVVFGLLLLCVDCVSSVWAVPTFTARNVTTGANGASSVFAVDIDDDGDMDLLSASKDDDTIRW